jgi:hypothetical protein
MKTTLQLEIREVYGCPNIYPACDSAKKFAQIAKTKTLSLDALKHIHGLGFKFDFIAVPLSCRHIPDYFKEQA